MDRRPDAARPSGDPEGPNETLAGLDRAEPGARRSVGLELIVRDLARALGAEVALLAVRGHGSANLDVLAGYGPPSRDRLPSSLPADGFLGRALGFEAATVEPIDPEDPHLGTGELSARATHAASAPVRPLDGPAGLICASFSNHPSVDLAKALWLIERYAYLSELCIQDGDALETLLSGGHVDGLTGCVTQAEFLRELRREIARSDRHKLPLSCAFIDLDSFKRVNDRYGHLHGSRLLATVASVLRAEIRSEDTIGRYGGDEFVLLLPNTDEAAAVELAGRLRAMVARTMINLPHDAINASIGVAQWQPGSLADALLTDADEALLAAKATGGGTVIPASTLTRPDRAAHSSRDPPSPGTTKSRGAVKGVAMSDVLKVLADFDASGGASIELTAWELRADPTAVARLWATARAQRLITLSGTDPGTGEEMWRLSDDGRRGT
jgi:diguanylate cyclase (GGDEF)-like protein